MRISSQIKVQIAGCKWSAEGHIGQILSSQLFYKLDFIILVLHIAKTQRGKWQVISYTAGRSRSWSVNPALPGETLKPVPSSHGHKTVSSGHLGVRGRVDQRKLLREGKSVIE